MLNRISMLLLSGAIGLSLTGCAATTSPTMRAQSPGYDAYGGNCQGAACNNGACYGGTACPTGYGSTIANSHPSMRGCTGGADCRLNMPFYPVHRNFYTVKVPQNLRYPQDNTPAAVYQYPYYTTRGPTDFFME